MLTEKAEGRIAMLIVDKLAFQEKLSEGEKTLAAYILAHGMEIAKYSTRSLAEVTYTSPPTVLRLCKKLGFTGEDDPVKVEFDLMEVIPKDHWILYNIHIITLGRSICTARKPDCGNCFLKDVCPSAKA